MIFILKKKRSEIFIDKREEKKTHYFYGLTSKYSFSGKKWWHYKRYNSTLGGEIELVKIFFE